MRVLDSRYLIPTDISPSKNIRFVSEIIQLMVGGKLMMFSYRSIYLVMNDLSEQVSISPKMMSFSFFP